MNASPALANLLRRRLNQVRAANSNDTDQPVRMLPVLSRDDLPPGFEDILKIQVLGYRDRLVVRNERRLRVLEPVWTLVPNDR
jgi:hypothetical protein